MLRLRILQTLTVNLALLLAPVVFGATAHRSATREFSVAVYCASSPVDSKYLQAANRVGTMLAEQHWTLVWGGADAGMMGAVANGAKSHGGHVAGVMPEMFRSSAFRDADELTFVPTVEAGKACVQHRADAFVVLPGGCGTLDEFFDVLELRQLGVHHKPVIVFNQDGYYDKVLAFIEQSVAEGFTGASVRGNVVVVHTLAELLAQLKAASATGMTGNR